MAFSLPLTSTHVTSSRSLKVQVRPPSSVPHSVAMAGNRGGKKMKKKNMRLLALLLAAVLALSACGGGNKDDSSGGGVE